MKAKLRKIFIYMLAFLSGCRKCKKGSKVIYIAFFGRIGDGIMFLDMLDAYKRLYPSEQGYKIVLGCRNEIKALLTTLEMHQGIDFLEVNREKLLTNVRYFLSRVKETAKLKPELILHVRMHSNGENAYLYAVPASRKIAVKSYSFIYGNRFSAYFDTHTYDSILVPDEKLDQLSCYAELLRYLGATEYKSKVARMPSFDKLSGMRQYFAVCPGASAENKCWPVERYVQVVDHLIETYDRDIVICGGSNDIPIANKIQALSRNKERITISAGKTSMAEWFSLIQHADFVLANESAATHIAAAYARKCVCIGEQKFGDKWLPYRPEYIRPDDQLPIIVRGKTLDCAFCAAKGWFTNAQCKRCIQEHGVSLCVYDVTAEAVICAIDKLIGQNS